MITEVDTGSRDVERLAQLAGPRQVELVHGAVKRGRARLAGRAVVNVNSTARGGGVAEMLLPLVAYARGAGIDCRWLVIEGDPEFFSITKRIHNRLHGAPGDGGPLDADQRAAYERTLALNYEELSERIGPRDVVILSTRRPPGSPRCSRTRGIP